MYDMRACVLLLLGVTFPLVECQDEGSPQVLLRPVINEQQQQCTVEDILPGVGEAFQPRWIPLAENETRSQEYNCTCPFTRASYFCWHGRLDYPSWVPKAVAEEECTPVGRHELVENPFPPGMSVLFYGNSHLRQVVEGIMCLYGETIVAREALLVFGNDFENTTSASVPPDRQCRGHMQSFGHALSSASCVSAEGVDLAVRCSDDRAVFRFANDATVHYWFAHLEGNKSVEDAFDEFGTSIKDYDIIVANSGNSPPLTSDRVVGAAEQFYEAGVPFLWLSTYDGVGNIDSWSTDDRVRFEAASGKYLAVHDMMSSLEAFTRGAVDNLRDDHFCLPGPPNELGVLVLRLIWALREQQKG